MHRALRSANTRESPPVNPARAVFTIAVGRPVYLRMAYALARSFLRWNDPDELPFFLATDVDPTSLPRDLARVQIIPLRPGQFGQGFTPKLYLDQMAPAIQSLFVDADCLCTGSLRSAFEGWKIQPVPPKPATRAPSPCATPVW